MICDTNKTFNQIQINIPKLLIFSSVLYICTQEDLAFKQKQREDKKKLEEAKARAGQKGPMGMCMSYTTLL